MTTNVIDLQAGVITTDSRWSYQGLGFALYVDDTGFEKIVEYRGCAFTFAGDGALIQSWKDWLKSNPTAVHQQPEVERKTPQGLRSVTLSMVDMATKKVTFCRGNAIKSEEALFAGSGARQAKICWETNKDAKLAVKSAILVDIFSGGTVKYLEFKGNKNNLNETATIQDVNHMLATKGQIMSYANQNAPNTVLPATGADVAAEREKIVEQLRKGEVAASAPCDAMFEAWSEGDKTRLTSALQDVFSR